MDVGDLMIGDGKGLGGAGVQQLAAMLLLPHLDQAGLAQARLI